MRLTELGRQWAHQSLSKEDVYRCLANPVIAHTLSQLKALVLRKPWIVVGSNSMVTNFVFRVLSPIWNKIILKSAEAVVWGVSTMEVVWDVRDVSLPKGKDVKSAVVVDDLVFIPPYRATFLMDEDTHSIIGFRVKESLTTFKDITNEKAFWVSHMGDTIGSPYGVPLLVLAKPYEEMFQDLLQLLAVAVENQASPPLLGRAPLAMVETPEYGEVPAAQYMAEKLKELRSVGATVIPSEFEQGGQPLWTIEAPLKFTEASELTKSVETIVTLLRLAIFGVSATFVTGTASQTPVPGEDLVASFLFNEILDALNSTLVRYLVWLNWGEDEWAVVDSAETGQVDIDLVRDLVRATLQFYPEGRSELFGTVDWQTLFNVLGLPTLTGKEALEIAQRLEEILQKAQRSSPTLPGLGLMGPGLGLGVPLGQAMAQEEVESALEGAGLKGEASGELGG